MFVRLMSACTPPNRVSARDHTQSTESLSIASSALGKVILYIHMLPRIILLTIAFVSGSLAAAPLGVIHAEEWAHPRSGETLVQMPALKFAVSVYLQNPGLKLLIHHPLEEEGLLWGEELRTWLIALGIVDDDVQLIPSDVSGDRLEIHVGLGE
jgi:hypothetical protein